LRDLRDLLVLGDRRDLWREDGWWCHDNDWLGDEFLRPGLLGDLRLLANELLLF
jgi:hypothetical protein